MMYARPLLCRVAPAPSDAGQSLLPWRGDLPAEPEPLAKAGRGEALAKPEVTSLDEAGSSLRLCGPVATVQVPTCHSPLLL
jgi:hypothetical protein